MPQIVICIVVRPEPVVRQDVVSVIKSCVGGNALELEDASSSLRAAIVKLKGVFLDEKTGALLSRIRHVRIDVGRGVGPDEDTNCAEVTAVVDEDVARDQCWKGLPGVVGLLDID